MEREREQRTKGLKFSGGWLVVGMYWLGGARCLGAQLLIGVVGVGSHLRIIRPNNGDRYRVRGTFVLPSGWCIDGKKGPSRVSGGVELRC